MSTNKVLQNRNYFRWMHITRITRDVFYVEEPLFLFSFCYSLDEKDVDLYLLYGE